MGIHLTWPIYCKLLIFRQENKSVPSSLNCSSHHLLALRPYPHPLRFRRWWVRNRTHCKTATVFVNSANIPFICKISNKNQYCKFIILLCTAGGHYCKRDIRACINWKNLCWKWRKEAVWSLQMKTTAAEPCLWLLQLAVDVIVERFGFGILSSGLR